MGGGFGTLGEELGVGEVDTHDFKNQYVSRK